MGGAFSDFLDADGKSNFFGGHTLVNFATAGRITEVLPDGSVGWQVSTGLGDVLG